MKNLLIQLLLCFILFVSCNNSENNNINMKASIDEGSQLKDNPLLGYVITTSITPREKTMQTLYANKVAWDYANTHSDSNYPDGSKLYAVTWEQKTDPVWFGANIPKTIVSVEMISFSLNGQFFYKIFKGRPLKEIAGQPDNDRITYLLAQKIAPSP